MVPGPPLPASTLPSRLCESVYQRSPDGGDRLAGHLQVEARLRALDVDHAGRAAVRSFDERPAAALKDGDYSLQGAAGDTRVGMVDGGVVLNIGSDEADAAALLGHGCVRGAQNPCSGGQRRGDFAH